jgi:hypothetical protein
MRDGAVEKTSKQDAPKINWDDEFAKYGSPYAAKEGGSAAAGDAHVADFHDQPRWAKGSK